MNDLVSVMRPGTIKCVLCQGIVSYCKDDTTRFIDHMNYEHATTSNLRFILAGCLMNEDERNVVSQIIEDRESDASAFTPILKSEDCGARPSKSDHSPQIKQEDQRLDCTGEDVARSIHCPQCDKTFPAGKNLKVHLFRYHKMKSKVLGSTAINSSVISEKENLQLENKKQIDGIDSAVARNQCLQCETTFSTLGNLSRHVRTVHKQTIQSEKSNFSASTDQPSIEKLSSVEELEDVGWSCELCSYSSFKESSLKIHKTMKHKHEADTDAIKWEYGNREQSCVTSNNTENNSNTLKDDDAATDVENISKCAPDVFEVSNRLMPSSKSSNQCKICDAILSNAGNLKRHLQVVHKESVGDTDAEKTGIGSAPVNQSIPNAEEEDVEQNIDTPCSVNATPYQCQFCDYSCSDNRRLKIHSSSKHKGKNDLDRKLKVSSKLFKKNKDESTRLSCSVCDFKSTSDKEMHMHKLSIHRQKMKEISSSALAEDSTSDVNVEEEIILEDEEVIEEIRNCNKVENEIVLNSDSDKDMYVSLDESINSEDSSFVTIHEESEAENDLDKKMDVQHLKDKRYQLIKRSEYFSAFSNNLKCWFGDESKLTSDLTLPQGFSTYNVVTKRGRKYIEYVTPDRSFRLRSMVAVLEYMKTNGGFSEEEIRLFEAKMKVKNL